MPRAILVVVFLVLLIPALARLTPATLAGSAAGLLCRLSTLLLDALLLPNLLLLLLLNVLLLPRLLLLLLLDVLLLPRLLLLLLPFVLLLLLLIPLT